MISLRTQTAPARVLSTHTPRGIQWQHAAAILNIDLALLRLRTERICGSLLSIQEELIDDNNVTTIPTDSEPEFCDQFQHIMKNHQKYV